MLIEKLEQLFGILKDKEKKRLIVAWAVDAHTIEAVNEAVDLGLVYATLVGDRQTIMKRCEELNIDAGKFVIDQVSSDSEAAERSVSLINEGKGNMIMKGNLGTEKYMKAILNKESGLMVPNEILSHVAVVENPVYHKLMIISDAAIIPLPDLKQKIAQTCHLINTAKAIGLEKPKVALIAATEQPSPNMPASTDAAVISKMAERGRFGNAFVEGPLALDLAVDKVSADIKGIKSEVAGDADCLLFPNIESGNIFYKTNSKLAAGEQGAIVVGAKVPVVLSSRGDTSKTKLYSIALAAITA